MPSPCPSTPYLKHKQQPSLQESFIQKRQPFFTTIKTAKMRFSLVSSALLFAVSAIALPTSEIVQRQSSTTCGNNYYSYDQVSSALDQGYNYYANGEQVGNNDYPHSFTNYEGFALRVDGPYQEFPILESGVYTGGEYYDAA